MPFKDVFFVTLFSEFTNLFMGPKWEVLTSLKAFQNIFFFTVYVTCFGVVFFTSDITLFVSILFTQVYTSYGFQPGTNEHAQHQSVDFGLWLWHELCRHAQKLQSFTMCLVPIIYWFSLCTPLWLLPYIYNMRMWPAEKSEFFLFTI